MVPLFGFANAGVSFAGMSAAAFGNTVSLGIAGGLFAGKQIGVFLTVLICVRLRLARLPDGVGWLGVYGAALLAGIGFTMSLFIGTLAWDTTDYAAPLRIGVLGGSLLSGVAGYLLLRFGSRPVASA